MRLTEFEIPMRALIRRFALIYLPIVIALTLIVFYYIRFDKQLRVESVGANEGINMETASQQITHDLSDVNDDLHVIVNLHLLRRFLDSGNPGQREDLEKIFQVMARETRRYDQIRYLDNSGNEIIRINYNGGKPTVTPHEQLQNKSDRYYFTNTLRLNQGEVFISPIDLNIEHGRLEIPYKPTIRFGQPVYDSAGLKKGVIILNYLGDRMLQDFRAAMKGYAAHEVMLVNRDGYWLQAPNPNDEWGFMRDKYDHTFGHDFPNAWRTISTAEQGSLRTEQGLFIYRTVYPLLKVSNLFTGNHVADSLDPQGAKGHVYFWKIVSFVPNHVLFGAALYNQPISKLLFLVVYLMLAFLAILIARTSLSREKAKREIINLNVELEKRLTELASSKENLAVTLNSIGDAVISTDVEGRVTGMNIIAEQLTGWPRAEGVGRPVSNVFHIINQQTRQPATVPVAATLAQGIIHALANDTVLIARDGKERPIADSCAPILDRAGVVIGAVLVFRDVTEEYAAKTALRNSATRIQAILNTVADGIITINERGIVESINPAAEHQFGYTATEVTGKNVSMLMPEPYCTLHDKYIEHYCATGEARVIGTSREVVGRRKNGDTFPMYLAISETRLDGQRYFTGVVHDITKHKVAEDRLNSFFSLSLDMLCIASSDGYFKRINPAFTEVLGWSTEEILTRPFIDFVHPDDHAATLHEVERQVAASENVLHFENRYLHKDGSWRTLSWKSVPYDGGFMFATARDVTEQKQMEHELVAAKEQAEHASRAKDSFLATMSHEIRTPLTGILGMLELLSMYPLGMEERTTLDAAWSSGRSLLRIVNDILDWSKIAEGKVTLALTPTSVPSLLQEVINTYSGVASAKSLILRLDIDPRLKNGAHLVDGLRLSQILNNYVSNAIKFTKSGVIELRAELLDKLDSGEKICFSVKDTGAGIAQDVQQHLFQRYRQGSADIARMYGGTGLGLAICQRLAQLMDGQVMVESELGKGSTFTLTLILPVSGLPGQQFRDYQNYLTEEQNRIEPLHNGSVEAPLILVVDDNSINRKLLAQQINQLGLRSETAEDGEVALSMWRSGGFTLVITDCHMPEMDGYAFSRAVRKIEADEKRPRTPIIAWTANALAEESEACHNAGMDELLVKPTNLQKLSETIAKWLRAVSTVSSQPIAPSDDTDHVQSAEPINYAELEVIMPDRASLIQILREFQSNLRADRSKLLELLDRGNISDVEQTAHRMKGSCRMVSAMNLTSACATIEHSASEGTIEGARAGMTVLDEAITQLEKYLTNI